MLKRRLVILFCLIGVGAVLTVHAQQDQPMTQPTIDAAVSTLIAQTQQAPAHLGATQTIQVALGQALTATTQAMITPTPTPQSFDAANLKVSSTTEVDLIAGPTGAAAYFAPDGQQFAYLSSGGKMLCVYRGSSKGNCVDPTPTGGVETESPRWSPDSRYVVFSQDFFRYFRDSDIWVWDTVSNQLNDLTQSSGGRINFITATDWTGVDVVPRWTPDGRIVFLRYSRQSGTILPPDVYVVAPDGSGLKKLGSLAVSDRFAVYALDVWHDKLVYGYASQAGSPMDGLWISDLDGNNAHQVMPMAHDTPMDGVEMSPDGKYVLVTAEYASTSAAQKPENSRLSVVDVASGQSSLIDPTRYVSAAGWSPQGSALVYVTHDLRQEQNDSVFLTNTPGTAGQQLSALQGRFNLPTPRLQQTLTWGANNTVLISHSPGTGVALVQLGV